MAELESLTKKRQTTRASVTRIKNIISSAMSFAELECRLSLVEAYFKQLLSIQSDIEELNPNDVGRADIEDLCIRTKSKIIQLLGDNFKRPTADMSMAIPVQTSSKLPTLELPTFDLKYTDYKNFISSFKQFVDTDSSLQAIEKFNHLLHCLRGPALDTVRAFQVTSENYEKALKQLEDRYDNTTLIFLEYIQHLYDLPIVPKPSCVQLRSLVDSASAIYSSLKSLGTVEDICNAFIIQLISQKTDRDTQIKWREHMDYSQLPSWDKFCKHLERRCQFLESSESHSTQTFSRQNNNNFQHRNMYQNRSSFHAQQKSCLLCKNSEHWLSGCNNFKAMNHEERFATIKKLALCLNCLSEGHMVSKCTSKNRCKICSKSHHTLLHRPVSASQSVNTTVNTSLAATSTSVQHQQLSTASVNAHLDSKSGGVILATAVILVTDHNGEFQLCRALLDSCSQVNLITESFSRVLNLGRKKCAVNIVGVGNSSTNIKYETYATVRSRYTTEDFPLRFFITKRVSGYQPEMDLDISNWNLPSDIKLADVDFNKSQVIDMLIGADAFFDILGKHKVKLNSNLPILQETSFGYVVSGRYTTEKNCQDSYTYSYTADLSTREEDENLNKQLEVLWNMEKVARSSVPKSEYEACEAHFLQHVEFSPENRIQVKLPFLEDPPLLGTSHSSALRRFCQLEKSLVRNEEVREQYITFMREYESLGHMTLVNPDLNKPHYYIPHKFVLKPNSTTTKLRVVFDASSKTSSMDSLNDKLLTGPTIQDDLFSLLIQFRLWKYALSGDIEKMYRMVLVHPNHRPFQLILWRESDRQPISTYQLNTITYGMSASPFLAIRAMHFLADKYKREYQIGSEIVKTKFYVDDMLTGANDLETLLKIKYETTALLSKGGFNLTKFRSNCTLAQAETTENKNINETSVSNALGIIWNPTLDIFKFAFNPKKLFGLVCPIVIIPRVLLQDLWIAKIDWDKTVPQKSKELFTNFLQDLENLSLLKIPRYILQPNSFSLQLHGFSDASIRAYGCCMYIRSTDKNGNIVTNLVTAKCRVAPTRKKTMPQLELCGAHLLSKLFTKIYPRFARYNPETFLWTDSTVVLQWLKKHSSTLVTFVGNRISEIQEETRKASWRHVPTTCNPADIISRGCNVHDLMNSIWFCGPGFLKKEPQHWPPTLLMKRDPDVESAVRKVVLNAHLEESTILTFINRTSSYHKIVRVVAWMLRFRYKNKRNTYLTPDETSHALHCVIWTIQQHYFEEVFKLLVKNQQITNTLKSLSLFIQDIDGFPLIRVGGRLQNADIPGNRKHPFLLPKNCHFSNIIVRDLHITNYHSGPKALQSFIRQQFWIIGSRDIARKVVRSCPNCIRYRPKLQQQLMGQLPSDRVTPARPFERCGVDFCGPVSTYLKIRGKQPYKCYIAIFICFVTKAVHIEAVSDLSSDAFIAALKRLIGRRGLPSTIFCDNATNFVGADTRLREFKKHFLNDSFQENLIAFCTKKFITFKFIPPRAPHFGGVWEAAVKSAKGLLYRTLANAKLTFEELITTLIEIEAIMNSRPISPLSSDPNDFEALMPGHLLIGAPLNSIPEPTINCGEISDLQRWKRITAAKQKFWKQWSTDYLNELMHKTRWNKLTTNITLNTLVLIHEDNVPPMKWVIGRIVATYPGKDGHIRVADIKTTRGVFRRPVRKLAVLLNP